MKEIWKDVVGYEGLYLVSNLGNVASLRFNKTKLLTKSFTGGSRRKRYRVGLTKDGKLKTFPVHLLVAMSFLGHKPCKYKAVIDHIDNNPLNNNVDNLQIITNRDNCSKDKKGKTSKYTGVSFCADRNLWLAQIRLGDKKKNLGRYTSEYLASLVYKRALNELRSNKTTR